MQKSNNKTDLVNFYLYKPSSLDVKIPHKIIDDVLWIANNSREMLASQNRDLKLIKKSFFTYFLKNWTLFKMVNSINNSNLKNFNHE